MMAMSIVRAHALPRPIWIRTAAARDVGALSEHFGSLSQSSRHSRFMGAVGDVGKIAHDCLAQRQHGNRFTLVAEMRADAGHRIVGEASYAFDRDAGWGEFAISVADRWQRRGLGSALLAAVQSRAVSLGYLDLFGETLRTNEAMRRLAYGAGFAAARTSDWRAVRFDKRLTA